MTAQPFTTATETLAWYADHEPGREAMAFPLSQARLTFQQWRAQSVAVARGLLASGVRPGDHIALLAESRIEWPVVAMGVAMMGGVLVPLNTHYRADDLRYALTQSGSRAVIFSPAFRSNSYLTMIDALRPALPGIGLFVTFDQAPAGYIAFQELLESGMNTGVPLPDVAPDAIAFLLYTSGTTGFPKGALITHRAAAQNAWAAGNRLDLGPADTLTTIVPLFHNAGIVGAVLNALVHGARYAGVPYFDPETMFRIIQDERCTWITSVPTGFVAMLDHPARSRYDLSSLRVGTCGGADVNPEMLRRVAREFPIPGLVQVYGQTETTSFISLSRPDDPHRYDSAGPPVDGLEARITDPVSRAVLPAGAVGQIEVRGLPVMAGYFDRPEDTAAAIDADGWLQTGDLGHLLPEGHIVLAGGRLKDMIVRGGENVYPVEVENVLAAHPAVAEAAVFALPDDYYGEIVAAAVKTRWPVVPQTLVDWCSERIARYKAPARWFRAESFPLTASGKIRKRDLRDMALAGALESMGGDAPGGQFELPARFSGDA